MGDNGKPKKEAQEQPQEQKKDLPEAHLGTIKVGDKDVKIVNSASIMEIRVHKLETGQEVSQVIAHEFMMVEHKTYLVRLLTDAIMTVMRAKKRENLIKLMSEATFNKLARSSRLRNFLRKKK